MKKLTITALCLCLLTGCLNTENGSKHGYIVKVSKSGLIWGTYEAELIRGGFTDASGANGKSFNFSLGVFSNELVDKANHALAQNKPVALKFHCEAIVAPWRGGHACFADDITILESKHGV